MIETQNTDDPKQTGIDCRILTADRSTALWALSEAWRMWLRIDLLRRA
jgi:hypothetical protein